MKKNIIIIVLSIAIALLSALSIIMFVEIDRNKFESIEVERKYIVDVDNLPEGFKTADIFEMVQTYISFSPEMRVRKTNDLYHFFTMKLPKDDIGLAREEIEFMITAEEYDELLKKQVGNTIYKKRYQFYENKVKIEVDIYSGDLTGLAVAEIEFANVKKSKAFVPPKWLGTEVTSDFRYKNANLARDGMPS